MRFKITPPVASPHAVERTQVLDRVAQCVGIRLVLVRAPAGYGKTTTLAQLHRRLVALDVDCVWLQFDEADNDVSRFVASVRHALVGAASRTTRRAARDESDPAEMPLAAISRRRTPFALFIDDMEAVSSPAVLALVAGMIVRLPPQAMVVIGSRSVPELGLARLRANGQLLEIGPRQLRLSAAQTSEFIVARRGLSLPSEQVAGLHRQTEGRHLQAVPGRRGDPAREPAGPRGCRLRLADAATAAGAAGDRDLSPEKPESKS